MVALLDLPDCEAICAFANDLSNRAGPGYLLIGVKDNGTLSGLTVTDTTSIRW